MKKAPHGAFCFARNDLPRAKRDLPYRFGLPNRNAYTRNFTVSTAVICH